MYYAATQMEAAYCNGSTVVVCGGGNSAGQAAMFLSGKAERVLLVIRAPDLHKSMSSYLSRRVEAKENIEILACTEVRRMEGGTHLQAVHLENVETGEMRRVDTPAVFCLIGALPRTDWLPPEIERDEKASSKRGAMSPIPNGGPSQTASRDRRKPADRASSPPATCAAAASSG